MTVLKVVLLFIEIVSCLLLVVLVLLQRSKSEGLGLAFGSEMGESLFGARAGNVLVKATVWLGIVFLVNTTVLAKIYTSHTSRSLLSGSSVPAPVERTMPAQSPASQPEAQPTAPSAPASVPMTPAAMPAASLPVAPVATPVDTPAPAATPASTP